jgi:putative ABC transport system permease protein
MRWLDHLGRDIRHATRSIARMPGVATVVIVSLAIGIGVNAAIFSWIQGLVFKPLPGVHDAASFQLIEPRSDIGSHVGTSWLEYRDLREQLRSFQDVLTYKMVPFTIGEASRTVRTYGQLVSGNYFTALGLEPALGRFPTPDEVSRPGSEPVVVISDGFWKTRLAGASDVVGRRVRVNEQDLTIIGVAPPKFQGTVTMVDFDLWVPATMAPVLFPGSKELDDRGSRGYAMMGRLKPNVSREQAQREADAAMRGLAKSYPETNASIGVELFRFWQAPRGPQQMLIGALAILQGIMLILLLSVCANTANLILARATARRREVGIRQALGASRWRVVSLLLTESLLLALLGAGLGTLVAMWGTNALRAVPMIGAFPIRFQTSLDVGGLAFAIGLGLLCGLIFGAAPALQLSRVNAYSELRSSARAAPRARLRNGLMGAQVAFAVIVLVAAALFYRSFSETRDMDPGFRREGVLLAAYDLSGRNVDTTGARLFAAKLLERARALPGVEAAAISTSVPLDIHGLPNRAFVVEGRARADASEDIALANTVTPGYFRTMGIPMRAGHDFAELTDDDAGPQAIVNEEFVRRYLEGGEAIGRRVTSRGKSYSIVGVVRTSTYDSFGERPKPIIYYSYRDRPSGGGEIHLRTRPGGETLLAPQIQRVVRELDPTLPLYDVRTLAEHVDKNLFLRKIPARMFVVLGPLLLALAAIGIYGVVAYTVSHRTAEIGVRIALGATSGRVVRQILRETLRVVGIGAMIGLLMAFLVAIHAMRGAPINLVIFLGVPAVLMLVAAGATWVPARRASGVDPVVALRTSD